MSNSGSIKIKTLLFSIFIILILSGIVYYNKDNYKNAYENLLVVVGINGPCKKPIEYSLGTFDSEFDISKQQFLSIAEQSAKLWNNAVNKELFKYSDSSDFKINLIYDNRQKATTDMQQIGNSIDTNKNSYETVKMQYQVLGNTYNNKKIALENLISKYNSDKSEYENMVSSFNNRENTSNARYETIEVKRKNLNDEVKIINQSSDSLNILAYELNSKAKQLNLLASNINDNVSTYNNIGISTGLEFEEGEYQRDNSGERINIYQYGDHDKLLRVISHEFGHALGLDHLDNPKSVMYTLNIDSSITLSSEDISAVKNICGIK